MPLPGIKTSSPSVPNLKVCDVPAAEVLSYKTTVELAAPAACIEVTLQGPVTSCPSAARCAVHWSDVNDPPPAIILSS